MELLKRITLMPGSRHLLSKWTSNLESKSQSFFHVVDKICTFFFLFLHKGLL